MSTPYSARISQIRATVQAAGCAALVAVPGAGLRYLTGLSLHGYERLIMLLLPSAAASGALVVPALEHNRVAAVLEQHNLPITCYPWHDQQGPAEAVAAAAAQVLAGVAQPRIAVEYLAMRVIELRALEAALPDLQTTDATPLLARQRMVKDAVELAAMREAVRIIEAALQDILPAIKPGVTERELAALWRAAILAHGAEEEAFPCIVASGPNSAHPHHHNSERAFACGDLIILDGGAVYQGYVSDITRTVALGDPDTQARQIYALVQAANAAGRAAVQPDVTGAAIDRAAREVIVAGGYGAQFIHRTGHGLGIEAHEAPNIVAGSTVPLPIGTTFTVEPGIYVPGLGGVRIEDDLVITADGGESLTTFPRDLLVLGA